MRHTLPDHGDTLREAQRDGWYTDRAALYDFDALSRILPARVRRALVTAGGVRTDTVGALAKMIDKTCADTRRADALTVCPWSVNRQDLAPYKGAQCYPITDGAGMLSYVDARYHEPLTEAGYTPRVSLSHVIKTGGNTFPVIVYVDADGAPVAIVAPINRP
jgi:hypothetical protein